MFNIDFPYVYQEFFSQKTWTLRNKRSHNESTFISHPFVYNTISSTNNYYIWIFMHSNRAYVVITGKYFPCWCLDAQKLYKCKAYKALWTSKSLATNPRWVEFLSEVELRTLGKPLKMFELYLQSHDEIHQRSECVRRKIQLIKGIRSNVCTTGMHKQINQILLSCTYCCWGFEENLFNSFMTKLIDVVARITKHCDDEQSVLQFIYSIVFNFIFSFCNWRIDFNSRYFNLMKSWTFLSSQRKLKVWNYTEKYKKEMIQRHRRMLQDQLIFLNVNCNKSLKKCSIVSKFTKARTKEGFKTSDMNVRAQFTSM